MRRTRDRQPLVYMPPKRTPAERRALRADLLAWVASQQPPAPARPRRTQLDLFATGEDLPLFADAPISETTPTNRVPRCTCTARLDEHERGAECVPHLAPGEVMRDLFG